VLFWCGIILLDYCKEYLTLMKFKTPILLQMIGKMVKLKYGPVFLDHSVHRKRYIISVLHFEMQNYKVQLPVTSETVRKD